MSKEEIIKIIRDLPKRVRRIDFTGGEPFLFNDFLDILIEAKQKLEDIRIYSNLTLINEKLANRLLEINPKIIYTSI